MLADEMKSSKFKLRFCVLASGTLLTATTASAQRDHHWTEAENFGFHGPVHVVLTVEKNLSEDPRAERHLTFPSGQPRLEFDSHGNLVLQGMGVEDQTSQTRTEIKYDKSGRVIERSGTDPNGGPSWRNISVYGPHGVIEDDSFRGDELQFHTIHRYDERGDVVESATSRPGMEEPIHHEIEKFDEEHRAIEIESYGEGGQLMLHEIRSYREGGELYQQEDLNEFGQVITSITLHTGKLVNYWLSPEYRCTTGMSRTALVGWNDPDGGITTFYEIQCPRTLETTLERHPGRYGNIENDEEQRFGEDGRLLEKLEFHYLRDKQGNWIERTVLAWAPQSGEMIPIVQARRTITYY